MFVNKEYMGTKILFCDNSLRELLNFRGNVIRYYAEQGFEVVLVAPENCDYDPEFSWIKVVAVNMSRSGKNPFQDLKYCHTLWTIYKKGASGLYFSLYDQAEYLRDAGSGHVRYAFFCDDSRSGICFQ